MPKLTIMISMGPHAMAETTIEFATQAEMDAFLLEREAKRRAARLEARKPESEKAK